MLRGAELLFAAIFSVTFLKRSLNRNNIIGIACCLVSAQTLLLPQTLFNARADVPQLHVLPVESFVELVSVSPEKQYVRYTCTFLPGLLQQSLMQLLCCRLEYVELAFPVSCQGKALLLQTQHRGRFCWAWDSLSCHRSVISLSCGMHCCAMLHHARGFRLLQYCIDKELCTDPRYTAELALQQE